MIILNPATLCLRIPSSRMDRIRTPHDSMLPATACKETYMEKELIKRHIAVREAAAVREETERGELGMLGLGAWGAQRLLPWGNTSRVASNRVVSKGPLYPSKTKLSYLLLFDTTPFICL